MKRLIVSIAACVSVLLCLSGCMHQHEWIEATCTEPRTCAECGETEGEPLGHTPGEWENTNYDYVSATYLSIQKCTVCGETLDSSVESMTSFIENGGFTFTPSQFRDRFDNKVSSISGFGADYNTVDMNTDDGVLSYAIMDNEVVGSLNYVTMDGQTTIFVGDEDSKCNPSPVVLVDMSKGSSGINIAGLSIVLIESCDPSLSFSEAQDIAIELMNGNASHNGIEYLFAQGSDYSLIRARVA